jgi:hypothetical protein
MLILALFSEAEGIAPVTDGQRRPAGWLASLFGPVGALWLLALITICAVTTLSPSPDSTAVQHAVSWLFAKA